MEAFLALLPSSTGGTALRHAVEARHASFDDPAWPALAARHGVAVAIVDSDKHALHGDLTGFVYARLQRNQADSAEGYDPAALDGGTGRVRAWSRGEAVDDLKLRAPAAPAKRECFVFFISGDKERAPDSAAAMLARLAVDKR